MSEKTSLYASSRSNSFSDNSKKKYISSYSSIKEDLKSVLATEADAILNLINDFPDSSLELVNAIFRTTGRVVFSGMGKSGLIAKKLVSTFSSIGTRSLFLHPAEALHGDLGMLRSDDLFIAISKSGTGIELAQIISILKSNGNKTSLICCADGILSEIVDFPVILPFTEEACQMNLAPTTSSTLCMAFGDALGVVVSKMKKFNKNDFAKFHPAGALGRRLLLKVSSLMHASDLPLLYCDTKFSDLLYLISSKKMGLGVVVDVSKKILGIITDGDLRRAVGLGPDVFNQIATDIMSLNPKTVREDILAYDALCIMEDFNITSLIVVDESEQVVGLIHIHDLIKAGITTK